MKHIFIILNFLVSFFEKGTFYMIFVISRWCGTSTKRGAQLTKRTVDGTKSKIKIIQMTLGGTNETSHFFTFYIPNLYLTKNTKEHLLGYQLQNWEDNHIVKKWKH